MKHSILYPVLAIFLLAACAEEKIVQQKLTDRISVSTPSSNDITALNVPFTIEGKQAFISYTYRAYAEAPVINSTPLEATSIISKDNLIFVSWHTEGNNYGGAITVYQNNGDGNYLYSEILEFTDTDWHDLEVETDGSGTYTIFMVGQRNPDSSGYILDGHYGAVQAKVDYILPASLHFQLETFEEMPLHGYGANGVAIYDNGTNDEVYTVSGNGVGLSGDESGIYLSPAHLNNVDELFNDPFGDGEYVERNEFIGENRYVVMERVSNNVHFHTIDATGGSGIASNLSTMVATVNSPTSDVERNAMAWSGPDKAIAAMGATGLYVVEDLLTPPGTATEITSVGSDAFGVAVDTANGFIYIAAGDGGLAVITNDKYVAVNVLYDLHDLIGKFKPLTGGIFPSTYYVKDAAIYNGDDISIATGSGGVFFIEKD